MGRLATLTAAHVIVGATLCALIFAGDELAAQDKYQLAAPTPLGQSVVIFDAPPVVKADLIISAKSSKAKAATNRAQRL